MCRVDFSTIALRDVFRVGVVIVDSYDIGRGALPTIVSDHGACAVERFGEVIKCLDRMAMLIYRWQLRHAPRLVERHRHDDAWMTVIALYCFGPLVHGP